MGALFLYRGNLHRVADIPRRWPMPPRAISLTQFRHLLRKRNLAITQLSSRSPNAKPKPSVSNENHGGMDKTEYLIEAPSELIPSSEPSGSALDDCKGIAAITENRLALEGVKSMDDDDGKKKLICKLDSAHEKEDWKRDLEQKLHVLNEKKHYLVQMLKQILNAEEEIKRRSIQSGGELDAAGNYNTIARQWPPIPTVSPSATSIGRTSHGPFLHNTVHMPRGSAALQPTSSSVMANSMVSPSRFAPTGQQGYSMCLPSVSAVSGSHFAASSPSPAASGGTSSAFRDSR